MQVQWSTQDRAQRSEYKVLICRYSGVLGTGHKVQSTKYNYQKCSVMNARRSFRLEKKLLNIKNREKSTVHAQKKSMVNRLVHDM